MEENTGCSINDSLFSLIHSDNLSVQTVSNLIELGADINAVERGGNSFLMECIQSFIWNRPNIELINFLIKSGADVNYRPEGDLNCLGYAFDTMRPDLMEILLIAGANPDITCDTSETLLESMEFDLWHDEKYPTDSEGFANNEPSEENLRQYDAMRQMIELVKKYSKIESKVALE